MKLKYKARIIGRVVSLLIGIVLLVLAIASLNGCSTMDSFGEKGSCKATIEFECDCSCQQEGTMEKVIDIVK